MLILKTGHQPGVYVPLRALFLVSFLFHFLMKIKIANRIAPDGTPHFVVSHLGLFCLPLSHKKAARLIWVKEGIWLYM